MSMEGPPPPPEKREQKPSPWESVEEYMGLTAEEKDICATCTSENKDHLIAWFMREQERTRGAPTNWENLLLEVKSGCMQYIIAKDMQQREEAFQRLCEAKEAAEMEGMTDIAERATRAMDMFDSVTN